MKKLNLKKAAVIGMCCTLISTSTVFAFSENININNEIKVQINNEWVNELEPFIENERTLVDLNEFVEKLGAKVELDKETIKIISENITIELTIGKTTGVIFRNDGGSLVEEEVNIDVAPKLVDGNIFVPIRFAAENLGYFVQWDNFQRAVIIKQEGDIIVVERPIEFEIVDREIFNNNDLLLKLYNENYTEKGIYYLIDGDYIYVLLAAGEKPTGGYSLEINSITEVTPGTAYIHGTLNSPGEDSVVTQVLTYPNVMVKFQKGDINIIQWDLSGDFNRDEVEKNQVIKFVQGFGEQLRMVSLLAPEDILKETMNEYYSDYISAELMEKWLADPVTAPGKLTSSPWPGRIDVLAVEKISDNQFVVEGNIVEFTSVEVEEGGIAAKREIKLYINKVNEKWVIENVELGEYEVEG